MANATNTPKAGANTPAFDVLKRSDPPIEEFRIWPNRSLPPVGHRYVLLFACIMLAIPAVPFFAMGVGWTLLPFLLSAVGLLWYFLRRSAKDGAAQWENVRIWADLIVVERHDPGRKPRIWSSNPYWVRVEMRNDGPVENYLTLKGDAREIELGAFLSPDERVALRDDIERALGTVRRSHT